MDISELKTNRTMQLIAALLLASVLMVVGIVLNIQNIPELNSKRQQVEDTLAASYQRLSHLQNLAANEAQTMLNVQILQDALPAGTNQNEVFQTVQNLSGKYMLHGVEKITFDAARQVGDVNELPISITFVGDYTNVMTMLEEYTANIRLTHLNKISIRTAENAPNLIKADVEMSVFYTNP